MMEERYYIFSDETGHWSDADYYIRSWLILSENDYFKLQSKVNLFKKIYNIKNELKYHIGHDYSFFEDLNFEIYYTITFANKFRETNFQIINQINQIEESSFQINNSDIRDKIINSVKSSIFFNIYEYHHLDNIFRFLDEKYTDKEITFFIDSPQYQNRDWKAMFNSFSSNHKLIIINNSEKCEGIQFADVLARNMNKILEKIQKDSELNKFEIFLFRKFSQNNGLEKPHLNNPNIIMWDISHQELINKICKIKKDLEYEN